jgi:glyoxylase-like metal-dependent hydrolase (beta-lactamase superfamily II)
MIRNAFLLFALLIPAAASYAQDMPEPRTVRVSERVYVLLGPVQHANAANQGYMINATVIIGDKGVILVDSGGTHQVGVHIARAIGRITPKPVTHVINTHFHGDHYLGNSAFAGATIISSEKCRAMVLETGSEWLRLMEQLVGRKFPGTRPIAASVTYPEGSSTEMTLNGIRLQLRVPKGSHTAGDMLVCLPQEKVLVSGDILVNGTVPVMQDGGIKNWIGTLGEMQALDVVTFVPGHGDLMTISDVKSLQRTIIRFYAGVKAGYEKGLAESEIRKTLDLADWEKLERAYVIGRNINRAFLEIERDSFAQ